METLIGFQLLDVPRGTISLAFGRRHLALASRCGLGAGAMFGAETALGLERPD
jgi:hypothetical protein